MVAWNLLAAARVSTHQKADAIVLRSVASCVDSLYPSLRFSGPLTSLDHSGTTIHNMTYPRLEEPEFRLLAAVYATMGPDPVGSLRASAAVSLIVSVPRSIRQLCESLRFGSYPQRHILFLEELSRPCSPGAQDTNFRGQESGDYK